jgi:hypothetical protein
MKNFIILIILFLAPVGINGQNDYDCIKYDDFYILKTDSVENGVIKIKTSALNNPAQAELIYGTDYRSNRSHSELFEEDFIKIFYPAGLELLFSETNKNLFTFDVISNNYTLILTNGSRIKIGMSGKDLAEIFPKSYAYRKEYTPDPNSGRFAFIVFFCINRNGKTLYFDTWIIFILNAKDGVLEQFYSYVPG